LVVLLPQLGEFDSSEYCEFLVAADETLALNDIELRVIGIGSTTAAQKFCDFTGLPPDELRIVKDDITLYKELNFYNGPDLSIPDNVPDGVLKFFLRQLPGGIPSEELLRPAAESWLKYNAMCAGIGAPGTLREIIRGYLGDTSAPERFRDDDVVEVPGLLTIGPGVGPTKIGPWLSYDQWFSDERGYQRPVELATVRLKNMVEVLTKWDEYVGEENLLTISQRGGTYLFDGTGNELYSYKSRGVLTYSETMARPLAFLSEYIGDDTAMNPLGLKDNGGGLYSRGRGLLKPLGKAMNVLSSVFRFETKWQAKVLYGATDDELKAARKQIQDTISSNDKVVVYTYGLSPFSSEASAVLDEMKIQYKKIEVGLEWFLLDKEQSILRAALLEVTDQSSLPQIFIHGKHIGGLFTGGGGGGLATLKESSKLQKLLQKDDNDDTTTTTEEESLLSTLSENKEDSFQ